ncbi:uncharacterized protein LOC135147172 [Daucus carota subsp. sativus]|uniref:uncharacterized protein LOC135147172 n=1 Tax=Daucus carota subsp. sativus TaxID=79200 RepID=UPI00308303EB
MTEADKNFYFNARRVNVKQTSIKLINKLAKAMKFDNIPLIVTPFMSERFNAQIVPYQVQVAQPQQHQQQQQQQQQEQQLQLQLQQPPQPQPSPHQTPEPSPAHSPIHQQQYQSFEDEPLQYDFFEPQPSSSEPTLPLTQTQYSPQLQSTSQPLPSDSAINPELQAFRDDLQVAQNEAIEVDRPATVSCTESSTALALTLVQNQANTQLPTLFESTVFQNKVTMYENFADYSFFHDQELLGNVQVDLLSLASGGQFVPPLPLNPYQGTLVVYTAKLQAELARMIAENERLKGAQLVTLEKKLEEEPSSSYGDELKADIHGLAVEMRSNHELYMAKFDDIDNKLDQLLRNSKSSDQPSREDPSTKGEDRDKGGEDKGNSSNQSNKGNTNTSDSAPGREIEKSKGKQPMHQQEDNYDAFPKEMDDDDVFDATYCQNHEDGVFDEAYLFQTEEEAVDLEHEELVRKFKMENEARKRKLRDFQKLLEDKLITEEEIKKEKQKIYDAACV